MAFSIKMQAFVADRYYHYLKERFPKQAMDAFMAAFYRYATQRGIRAAQRAIRDGVPLDFENYQKYREVVSTPEMKAIDGIGHSEHTITDTEYISHVFECAAHRMFRELNSPAEVEEFFCRHIDKYNVEGFNADIPYKVVSTLYNSSCCTHCVGPAPMNPNMKLGVRMEDAPPYPFIISNEYFTMKKVIEAIFGEDGTDIAEAVKQDFIQYYELSDWEEICRYRDADFDIYYPKCMEM